MIESFQQINALMKQDGFTPPNQGDPWADAGEQLLLYIKYLRAKSLTFEVQYGKLLTAMASKKEVCDGDKENPYREHSTES